MDQPLKIEIITYAPTAFFHCMHCEVAFHEMDLTSPIHQEQIKESLPAELSQDFQALSDQITQVCDRYPDRVSVHIIDVASVEGLLKSLRYGIVHYPAILVNGKSCGSGAS
ncbi:MAG: hypothetical protein ACM3PY_04725, partial [Omnitrophica WOR_2 bacterium]